ncbi:MAG: FAD-dependent monooxygenase [Candidatus Acidiferrales bacterium]
MYCKEPLSNTPENTSVLVVGGSLVGLSTALFLAKWGVPVTLVEKHAGSSPHPRAIGYTARTMELFRAVGIADQIPQIPPNFRLVRARVESLAGKWVEEPAWSPEKPEAAKVEYSPCRGAAIAQDKIEPILRAAAIQFGADGRQSTELIGFEQGTDSVTAQVRNRLDGSEHRIRSSYLIACDGGASPIREVLGIGTKGRGHMRTVRSVLFRAPLQEYLAKGVFQFDIDQPGFKAFLTTYNDGRWVLMFTDEIERDDEGLKGAIIRSIGRSDLDIEIITTGRWNLGAVVADRFSSGRIFLAGDSAHAFPPSRGGYGANTGIHDANNLAGKLKAVLSGKSDPSLLHTYDVERRPVAWLRHQQIFARPDYKPYANGIAEGEPIIDDDAMELGQLYRSEAILGAPDNLPPALRPDEWNGQPGTRAPHLWLTRGDSRLSTLDLFQRDWVLLAEDEAWRAAAAEAAARLGIDLSFIHVATDVTRTEPSAFRTLFGLGRSGASLVRPDGYVAWRSSDLPAKPTEVLTEAFQMASFARAS